ncbi:Alanine aminotransferase 2 [Thelohanellus kitauei]|uniref:alanine transaminase n=1 Tax=Thelohanellus kitauei TaxID=669202 RepID=A0A0C2IWQ9_THEKT|nr:Alanine aminotransferase 2 [Thelohanellus kitauei]
MLPKNQDSESADMEESQTLDVVDINPCLLNIDYACRGSIPSRASQIQKELIQGDAKCFKKVVQCNLGDCQLLGQKPITFGRQILSACAYPELLNHNIFPSDVVDRTKLLLKSFNNSIGCYSESSGSEFVRNSVTKYIQKRDGYPADPNNIFITNGASSAIKMILYSLIKAYDNNIMTGIMVPVPQYPLYSASLSEFNGKLIPYYLNEADNWSLSKSEIERAITDGFTFSKPKALVVINPGNPTGQVLSYQNMVEIVKFCHKYKLVLLADEVYQHNVYDKDSKFFSFKKVVLDSGFTENTFTLVSFHSVSKGYYSECGIRGGYMELFGFKPELRAALIKLVSSNLCSSTSGQIILESLVNPPVEHDPSFPVFHEEKSAILDELRQKSELMHSLLGEIIGIKCNKIQGALYAFPQLFLPQKFIEHSEKESKPPDEYYCMKLLEETGVCVVPGSGFRQMPGTHHFRITIIPPLEDIKNVLSSISDFNQKLFKEFS